MSTERRDAARALRTPAARLDALGALRHAESVPSLTRVLAEAEHFRTTEGALQALSAFGPQAAEALPVVRRLWGGTAACRTSAAST